MFNYSMILFLINKLLTNLLFDVHFKIICSARESLSSISAIYRPAQLRINSVISSSLVQNNSVTLGVNHIGF